jgi:hypothetical protein
MKFEDSISKCKMFFKIPKEKLHKTLFFEKTKILKSFNIFTNNINTIKAPKVLIVWCTQVLGRYPKKSGYQIRISHSISLLIFEMIS